MGFHEKSAWGMLVILVASTAFYVWRVEAIGTESFWVTMPSIGVIIATIIFTIVAAIVMYVALAILHRSDAETLPDEREREFEKGGSALGYWALNAALLPVFWAVFTGKDTATIFHALAIATFVAAFIEWGSIALRHRLSI